MKLLIIAALRNRRHLALLLITLVSLFLLTLSSQIEMLSLGVIAKTGPDFFALFGKGQEGVSLSQVQERWSEVAQGGEMVTREVANRFLATQKSGLVTRVTLFLENHFHLDKSFARLSLVLVVVALLKAVTLFSQRYFTQLVSIRVSRDLRQRYFEHIQSLPLSFYHEQSIGALSSRAFGDATAIATALNSLLINYVQAPFAAISTLLACFFISWKLSLIIFVGFPLVVVPIVVLAKKIKQISRQMQKNQEGFASVLIDFLSGILTIKVFAMEEFSLKKYREQNDEMAKLEERSARYGNASRPILHTVSSLFFAAVILSGIYFFQMGPADLIVFCGLLYIFYEPIKKFAEENNQVFRGIAAAERMEEVLKLRSLITDIADAQDFVDLKESIVFRDVSFRYKEEWVLKKLNFTVKKGEMVALVGPTGSGKSSIVQLLPRLYDIEQGEILIDGLPLCHFRIRSLRDAIAFVPQKPFLFLDTIHENIAFGRPYSRSEVVVAAEQAHAAEFIEELPLRYDTVLHETGKNLSGGQQQRLAIARALVKKAPILILDEATSALDAMSEAKIKEAILGLHGKVTQIIIAHRFSTIEQADRIIYIERGEKLAEGSKAELLANCPPFREMWEMMQLQPNPL